MRIVQYLMLMLMIFGLSLLLIPGVGIVFGLIKQLLV